MSWVAIKAFFKKAWKFIKDQWLFFLTGVVGVVGFVLGSRDSSKIKEVLDIQSKGEAEERAAEKKAREEAELIMKKLDEGLQNLDEEERAAIDQIRENNREEFEREVIENRDKSLEKIVSALVEKYGLQEVE